MTFPEASDGLALGVECLPTTGGAFGGNWAAESDIAIVILGRDLSTQTAKSAAEFVAASSEHLEVDSAVFTAYPFSFGIWVNTSVTSEQIAFFVGDKDAANQWVNLGVDASGNARYQLNTAGLTNLVGANIDDGLWHFICAVSASATDHKLYVDGNAPVTSTTSKTLGTFDRTSIGRNGDSSPDFYWDGELQCAFSFTDELTAAEVANLRNAGAGRDYNSVNNSQGTDAPGPTDLSSFHLLDEASGTRNDSHGAFNLADVNTVTRAAGHVAVDVVTGALVQLAADQSGNGNDVSQASITARPESIVTASNSTDALQLDGTDDGLATTATGILSDTVATVIWVAKFDDVGAAAGPQYMISQGYDTANTGFSIGMNASEQWEVAIHSGTNKLDTYGSADTTRHIFIATFEAGESKFYIDGVLQTAGASAIDEDIPISTEQLEIGSRNALNFQNGDFSELVAFSAVKSDAKLNGYLDYLTMVYGIPHTDI